MFRFAFINICLLSFLTSCIGKVSNNIYNVKEVNLSQNFEDTKEFNLSAIGSKINYILLETKKECLIGNVEKCLVNNYGIFILSSSLTENALYFFNRNGKFNKAIGAQGRGPGEYTNIIDFDAFNDKIVISTDNSGVLVYDTSGTFLKKITVKSIVSSLKLDQYTIYLFHSFPFNYYNNDYIIDIIDNQTFILKDRILSRKTPTVYKKKIGAFPLFNFNSLLIYRDTIIYWDFSCDTIYSLKENKLFPRYFILKNSALFSKNLIDYIDLNTYMSRDTKRGLLTKYLELDDYVIFLNIIINYKVFHLFYNKNTSSYLIVDLNKYSVKYRQNTCFNNDLDDGWPFFPIGVTAAKELYGYFKPLDFVDYQKSRINQPLQRWKSVQILNNLSFKLNELSNPIIMIVN